MVETEKLESIISKCHIVKEFATLDENILGYYYCDGNYCIILINEKIKNNERLYRCVLAEELGHYRMTIGDITPRKYMCYSDRIHIDRQEQLALKWACDFLIPTENLLKCFYNEFESIHELSDHFNVTYNMLMQKLTFMSRQKMDWALTDSKRLYLHKLPSVFVYENII